MADARDGVGGPVEARGVELPGPEVAVVPKAAGGEPAALRQVLGVPRNRLPRTII